MKGFTALDFLQAMATGGNPYAVADVLAKHGIPRKVIWAHARTCGERGYWDCGVTDLAGWVTEKGIEKLKQEGRWDDKDVQGAAAAAGG